MATPVCVIVTVWNQAERTLECLADVSALDYPDYTVLIVDNGSTDDTAARLRATYPEVVIVATGINLGTSGGYNVGLRHGLERGFELLFLINNDTYLAPDCLTHLVAEAEGGPDIGLVMPKICYTADRTRIWSVGNEVKAWTLDKGPGGDGEMDRGQWDEPRDVGYAPFCAVLLTRPLLQRIGLLDKDFFLDYDDMDFCRRASLAGFRLRVAPRALMWHDVALSSGGPESPVRCYWRAQGSGCFFRKHAHGWRMLTVFPYRMASAVRCSLHLALSGRWRALAAHWLGLTISWSLGRSTTPPPRWLTGG